jgi:hypothetical protein
MNIESIVSDYGPYTITTALSTALSFVVFRGVFWRVLLLRRPWEDLRDAEALLALNAMLSIVIGIAASAAIYFKEGYGLVFVGGINFFISMIIPIVFLIGHLIARAATISVTNIDNMFAHKFGSLTDSSVKDDSKKTLEE